MTRLFLASILFLSIASCSSSSDAPASGTDSSTDSVVETTTPDAPIDSASDDTAVADAGDSSAADTPTETGGGLVSSLAGQWHGKIGAGYKSGCLCLNLDSAGKVIAPSGITLSFPVTSYGSGSTDTTVVDASTRVVTIHMKVSGSGFSIKDATVAPDSATMKGDWKGDTPSAFDDTIELDRLPDTCKTRTGLDGAPC